MEILGILIIAILIVSMIIGCIYGLVKGFTKVKSWGLEFLLSAALSMGVGGIFSASAAEGGQNAITGGVITIVFVVVFVVVFTFLFKLLRAIFAKLIKHNLERSAEENENSYGDYVNEENSREKPSAGFAGVLNRIFGGITSAFQMFVIVGFISALLLFAIDLSQFAFVESMADIYESATYLEFKKSFTDFFIVGVIMASVKCGYDNGIAGALWAIVILALIGFAGLASYHMAFNVPAFSPAAEKIAAALAVEGADSQLLLTIGRWILAAGLLVVMLVAVFLIAFFVPKIFGGLKDIKIIGVIDGVFGSIVATMVVLGILLAVGMVLQPITDLEFMSKLTSYFTDSKIATYFYNNDLIALMGVQIPIRDWLA